MCSMNEELIKKLEERFIELEKQSSNRDSKTKVPKTSKPTAIKKSKKLTKRQISKLKNSCTKK